MKSDAMTNDGERDGEGNLALTNDAMINAGRCWLKPSGVIK